MKIFLNCLLITLFLAGTAYAQKTAEDKITPRPKANPEDVESVDAIMAAIYDVISGEKGEKRDWDRFKSLFTDNARLMVVAPVKEEETWALRSFTPDEFASLAAEQNKKMGFFETEIYRMAERFDHIVHVFSTYESRHSPEDEKPFARGINSIQLMFDNDRWYVVTIYWNNERRESPLPARYLPGKKKKKKKKKKKAD